MKEDDSLKNLHITPEALRILMILNYSKSVAVLKTKMGNLLVCKN